MEKLALEAERRRITSKPDLPSDPPPPDWWEAVLSDPRACGRPRLPIHQLRLNEIPRNILRVECLRCPRVVEIQTADAIRL
jgi:hypothetical protein